MVLLAEGDRYCAITLVTCDEDLPKFKKKGRIHIQFEFLHRQLINLESENAAVLCLASPFGQHCTFYIFVICTVVRAMAPARIV